MDLHVRIKRKTTSSYDILYVITFNLVSFFQIQIFYDFIIYSPLLNLRQPMGTKY